MFIDRCPATVWVNEDELLLFGAMAAKMNYMRSDGEKMLLEIAWLHGEAEVEPNEVAMLGALDVPLDLPHFGVDYEPLRIARIGREEEYPDRKIESRRRGY